MLHHVDLGPTAFTRSKTLWKLQKETVITFAGNKRLQLYGTLSCRSGKRMKPEHRVFFRDEKEALQLGYRPCGHCMKTEYRHWKNNHESR